MAGASGEEAEALIAGWRSQLRRRRAIPEVEVAELEDRLRAHVDSLRGAGLADDEAFLVAVKRMGAATEETAARRREGTMAVALAFGAAVLIKLPELFGQTLRAHADFYARNASLAVLPLLAAYLAWRRGATGRTAGTLAAAFVVSALVVNLYPFRAGGDTARLAALHLPIALWMAVGVAYAGGRWSEARRRMDFVRFSGELVIHYVLIALGGAVLTASTMAIFGSIGADAEWFVQRWLLPCGAAGAVVVASWLVEAKQGVMENMAPVLGRLFTPLFAAVLLAFVATMVWTRRGIDIDRNVLIAFDLLLAVVLGLLLYSISARDPDAPARGFDWLLVSLVVSALAVDALALAAIVARISELGFTPNRVAALGENLILLVNLAWSAWLYARFLRGRGSFRAVERWQTDYLPVYAAWAAIVVIVFPPLFRFA